MSTTTHSRNGHAPAQTLDGALRVRDRGASTRSAAADYLQLGLAFSDTVVRYLLLVFPGMTRELAHWRASAAEIPDPRLRHHALRALHKRGNIEGAALFATLAPAAQRRRTLRALVAYQTAYNYLDELSEQPSSDPAENGRQLHQALIASLGPSGSESPHPDYYAYNPDSGDGGYLHAIVDACRDSFAGLPSYAAVVPAAVAAAGRIVEFQALNLSDSHGGHHKLQDWALRQTPARTGLAWWETAASAGSSLAVHALIAAAASPGLDSEDAREIDRTYFPWVGALHSLLDSLVDRGEDYERGQRSLLDYYASSTDGAIHLSSLALRAKHATDHLLNPQAHRVILTAMCSYYLSAPQCATAEGQTITRALTRALGLPLNIAIVMFRVRRLASAVTHHTYT